MVSDDESLFKEYVDMKLKDCILDFKVMLAGQKLERIVERSRQFAESGECVVDDEGREGSPAGSNGTDGKV